jgi:hypothetical protein
MTTLFRWTIVIGAMGLISCGEEAEGCTTAGCLSGFGVTVRPANGPWPDGVYSLTVTKNGTSHVCQVTLPTDLPALGSTSQVACQPPLGISGTSLSQDATCTEQATGDAVSQTCTPIPDRYTLSAFVLETPAEVAVNVARDGTVLVERTETLQYQENHPNGPGCEPTCLGANVYVTLE